MVQNGIFWSGRKQRNRHKAIQRLHRHASHLRFEARDYPLDDSRYWNCPAHITPPRIGGWNPTDAYDGTRTFPMGRREQTWAVRKRKAPHFSRELPDISRIPSWISSKPRHKHAEQRAASYRRHIAHNGKPTHRRVGVRRMATKSRHSHNIFTKPPTHPTPPWENISKYSAFRV